MNSSSSAADQEEWSGLAKLSAEELELNERLNYFGLSMDSATSAQIRGYINELDAFLGKFLAWRSTANGLQSQGRPAYSQGLEGLIQRAQYNLDTYQSLYNSRAAFERSQQTSGRPSDQF